jgi:hypothetical protein
VGPDTSIKANKMTKQGGLTILLCLDSEEMAAARRHELDIPRNVATALGRTAVEAAASGYYRNSTGETVDWSLLVNAACSAKRSIALVADQRRVGPE